MELFEIVKDNEKSSDLLHLIEGCLRLMKKWGRRGLYKELADVSGLSPAYVGQVLTGKKALTERFVASVADYMGVNVNWLVYGVPLDKVPPWLEELESEAKEDVRQMAHLRIEKSLLLNKGIQRSALIVCILDILEHLPIENIIDIRWQLVKLLDKNSDYFKHIGVYYNDTDILEMAKSNKDKFKCNIKTQVTIEKHVLDESPSISS